MKRDELRWIPKKPNCDGGSRGFVTVGLSEIKPAIILLALGYALSVLMLGMEILLSQLNAQCKKPKQFNVQCIN